MLQSGKDYWKYSLFEGKEFNQPELIANQGNKCKFEKICYVSSSC